MEGMNGLVTVDEDTRTVSARNLYKALGATERFTTWFERQLQYGFTEGGDFTGCKVFNTLARQELQDYNISLDMAKQICMLQRTPEGMQCRQYLIDLEKAWNTPEMIYARALKMADRKIKSQSEEITRLQTEVDRMKPKEAFADAVTASNKSILVRELAKILKQNGYDTGENRLFQYMRENGYLITTGRGYNEPTQKSMEKGLFEIEKRVITKNGAPCTVRTPLVTVKGQTYFINKLLKGQRSEG
jgi:anti-repressor protein